MRCLLKFRNRCLSSYVISLHVRGGPDVRVTKYRKRCTIKNENLLQKKEIFQSTLISPVRPISFHPSFLSPPPHSFHLFHSPSFSALHIIYSFSFLLITRVSSVSLLFLYAHYPSFFVTLLSLHSFVLSHRHKKAAEGNWGRRKD